MLRIGAAYATRNQVAGGLVALLEHAPTLEAAAVLVRRAILRTVRQREMERIRPTPAFCGRAVAFFRNPRKAARSKWWAPGIVGSWKAAGWVPMPAADEVPTGATSRRRRRRLLADSLTVRAEERYRATVYGFGRAHAAGDAALRLLEGDGDRWLDCVLEDWGSDYWGTLRAWQARAARGSAFAAAQLEGVKRVLARLAADVELATRKLGAVS